MVWSEADLLHGNTAAESKGAVTLVIPLILSKQSLVIVFFPIYHIGQAQEGPKPMQYGNSDRGPIRVKRRGMIDIELLDESI